MVANDLVSARKCFQNRICSLLNGKIVHPQSVVYHQNISAVSQNDIANVYSIIPSVSHLSCLFQKLKCWKALGEGDIPGDTIKHNANIMANLYHPIIVKCMTSFTEPVQWKGGIAFKLFKGKGSHEYASNYRFVLLADQVDKCYHRYIRSLLVPHISSYMIETCFSGFNHAGAEFGIMAFIAFRDLCFSKNLAWGILFPDVVAAFESLQRFFVFGERISDANICIFFTILVLKSTFSTILLTMFVLLTLFQMLVFHLCWIK